MSLEQQAINLASELLAEVQRLKEEIEKLKSENKVLNQLLYGK
jgi:Tfp pilus assembly protein PilN